MKLHITLENWKSELIQNIGSSNIGNIRKELYKRKDLHESIINETDFCAELTDINVRLTYIINGISNMNYCLECNDLINDGGKKNFCSFSCRAKNQAKNSDIIKKRAESYSLSYSKKSDIEKEQIKNNRKKTLKEKYGVEHNFNIEGFKEKRENTWINNYGNPIAQRSEEVKEKTKQTCITKYGGPNPLSDIKVKEKWLTSFYEKHGENNPMHVDLIKRKAFATRYNLNIEEVKFISDSISSGDLSTNIDLYTILVRILTEKTLSLYGNQKFGNEWRELRGKYKYHIDHSLTIRTGYLNKIDPLIIAHIENLNLIPCIENLLKGSKDNITINELQTKINEYETIKTA
jgi:hypothetical protein